MIVKETVQYPRRDTKLLTSADRFACPAMAMTATTMTKASDQR
jgi:hypothetical protein